MPGFFHIVVMVILYSVCSAAAVYQGGTGQFEKIFGTAGINAVSDLEKLMRAIDAVVNFYDRRVSEANVDGLFGLRVLEGGINDRTTAFVGLHSFTVPNQLKVHLLNLSRKVSHIAAKGQVSVRGNHPESFKKLALLVARPFVSIRRPSLIDQKLTWTNTLKDSQSFKDFDEAASDECFAAVLRAETSGTCQISDNCQDIMTRRHLSSYPMLHQILYSIVLESIPTCKAVWSQMLPSLGWLNMRDFQQEFCTNSYSQMINLTAGSSAHYPKVPSKDMDLFFEHLFVCPSLGYVEFLRPEYLALLLEEQDLITGCFKATNSGRHLLEEKELDDGCLFHKTSVAAGALVQYLQYYKVLAYSPQQMQVAMHHPEQRTRHVPSIYYAFALSVSLILTLIIYKKNLCRPFRSTIRKTLIV